ncbi:MAG: hypothetical protein ACYS5W_12135 [Planctomycetota bacterium]|jgi:phosphoglycerol transferase
MTPTTRNVTGILARYLGAAVLSTAAVMWLLAVLERDCGVPFTYSGDALYYMTQLKGLVENGTYMVNPALGAPTGAVMYDYPESEPLHFVVLRILTLLGFDVGAAINLYYLATFPLIVLCSLFVLERFGVGYGPALLVSMLYAFLYYHFMRNTAHLLLSAYYLVPLIVMVILWVFERGAIFYRGDGLDSRSRTWRICGSLAICLVLPLAHIYYSFFACFLLLVAGLAASILHRSVRPLIAAGALTALISTVFWIGMLPVHQYAATHGESAVLADRPASSAELHALKITQMVMPVTNHRIDALAVAKAHYNNNQEFYLNENDSASLGVIGSLGFAGLLFWLLFLRWSNRNSKGVVADRSVLMSRLSVLNLACVLLGTLGGLGMLVALFVTPSIRSYKRISIFIAFLSLFAVAMALEVARRRWVTTRARVVTFHVLLALLLALGVFDQTPRGLAWGHKENERNFHSDKKFVQEIERVLPENARVFQVPLQPFPEGEGPHRMGGYHHMVGYCHSTRLRWSFGAIRGRGIDLWQISALRKGPVGSLNTLALAGFDGIWVDRFGLTDEDAQVEKLLCQHLGVEPLVSDNGRLSFFSMVEYNRRLREACGENRWAEEVHAVFPVQLVWCSGFYTPEEEQGRSWRWCGSEVTVALENMTDKPRDICLEMKLESARDEPAEVTLTGLVEASLTISWTPVVLSREVTVPPGTHLIRFSCDGRPVVFRSDTRQLVFKIEGPHVVDPPR